MSDKSHLIWCPHLGLLQDRGNYCLFPDLVHRCYHDEVPREIPLDQQGHFCLGDRYPQCPVYQGRVPLPVKRPSRIPSIAVPAAALVAVVLLLAALSRVFSLVAPANGTGFPAANVSPAAPTRGAGLASPTARAGISNSTAAPIATATPAPSATKHPSSTATVLPDATVAMPAGPPITPAPGQRVHVVATGETLSGIANRYGTSVQAIARTNGITNTNFVYVGQRLIIP